MKKDGDGCLQGVSLGMEKLHKHIVGSEEFDSSIIYLVTIYIIGAHRALPDILAMEKVFT